MHQQAIILLVIIDLHIWTNNLMVLRGRWIRGLLKLIYPNLHRWCQLHQHLTPHTVEGRINSVKLQLLKWVFRTLQTLVPRIKGNGEMVKELVHLMEVVLVNLNINSSHLNTMESSIQLKQVAIWFHSKVDQLLSLVVDNRVVTQPSKLLNKIRQIKVKRGLQVNISKAVTEVSEQEEFLTPRWVKCPLHLQIWPINKMPLAVRTNSNNKINSSSKSIRVDTQLVKTNRTIRTSNKCMLFLATPLILVIWVDLVRLELLHLSSLQVLQLVHQLKEIRICQRQAIMRYLNINSSIMSPLAHQVLIKEVTRVKCKDYLLMQVI